MATNYWEGFICPICNRGFTLAQWQVAMPGDNDEEYHEDCFPRCNGPIDDDDDDWDDDDDDDFDNNWTIRF